MVGAARTFITPATILAQPLAIRSSNQLISNRHKWELEIESSSAKKSTKEFSNRLKMPIFEFSISPNFQRNPSRAVGKRSWPTAALTPRTLPCYSESPEIARHQTLLPNKLQLLRPILRRNAHGYAS